MEKPVAAAAAHLPDNTPKHSESNAMTMVRAPHIKMKSVLESTVNTCVTDAPSRKLKVNEVSPSFKPTSMICAMMSGMNTSSTTSNTTNTAASTDTVLNSPMQPARMPKTPFPFFACLSDISLSGCALA